MGYYEGPTAGRKLKTWKIDEEITLREVNTSWKAQTVIEMFEERVRMYGPKPALHAKRDGQWSSITFRQYYDNCVAFGKSLLHIGLSRFGGVHIIGFNAPEWLISDIGAIFAGGVAVGIYHTNRPHACEYIMNHSNCEVLVCDGPDQVRKIAEIKDNIPRLKAIVVYNGSPPQDIVFNTPVFTYEEFMRLGTSDDDRAITARMREQKPTQCCMVMYTSGTTGAPKGAMLAHDTVTWQVRALVEKLDRPLSQRQIDSTWTSMSYLPLSHIAAQILDIYIPLCRGMQVYFAQPDALSGTFLDTMLEVRPVFFLGVPRVWEKLADKIETIIDGASSAEKKVIKWAKGVGEEMCRRAQYGQQERSLWSKAVAESIVLRRVKKQLGLDNAITCLTSSAPASSDAVHVFAGMGLPIFDIYGSSELSGAQTTCTKNEWKYGSVGTTVLGSDIKTDKRTGELMVNGRNVMMGYLDDEEGTERAISDDGWYRTGDLAHIDRDGFVTITGRLKELIVTSGGENIAPNPIENRLKEEMPLLSTIMLVGDKRRFLSVLLTLPVKYNPTTREPTTLLNDVARNILVEIGSSATTIQEAQTCPMIRQYIDDGLARANERALSNAQRVNKYVILDRAFSVGRGELTSVFKLQRKVVLKNFSTLIEQIYQ